MKRIGFWALALAALLALPGCSRQAVSTPFWQHAAQAALLAQAYDAGLGAARLRDGTTLVRSAKSLWAMGAQPEAVAVAEAGNANDAEDEVELGTLYDTQSREVEKPYASKLTRLAGRHYRRALELQPRFNSFDPQKLNGLGYYLADQGTAPADFATAETLCAQSVALFDGARDAVQLRHRDARVWQFESANVRDSLAWALYHQGRFQEALHQQQHSVGEATAAAGTIPNAVPAELYYHLGEMWRATGNITQARRALEQALAARPAFPEARAALRLLSVPAAHGTSRA